MSDEYNWDFHGAEDARAEIRAAVGYLVKGAAGSDRLTSCGISSRSCAKWRTPEAGQPDPFDEELPGG